MRNTVTKGISKAKLKYFERVSEEAERNPGKVWKELSRLLGSGQIHVTGIKTKGGTLTDQKNIIEEFSRYFSSLAGALEGAADEAIKEIPACGHVSV